jgi:hypothetical protein
MSYPRLFENSEEKSCNFSNIWQNIESFHFLYHRNTEKIRTLFGGNMMIYILVNFFILIEINLNFIHFLEN